MQFNGRRRGRHVVHLGGVLSNPGRVARDIGHLCGHLHAALACRHRHFHVHTVIQIQLRHRTAQQHITRAVFHHQQVTHLGTSRQRHLGGHAVVAANLGLVVNVVTTCTLQFNGRRRGRHVVYGVVFGVGLSGAVTRRVGHCNLGFDAAAANQFVGGGAGAKAPLAVAQNDYLGGQLAAVAQRQSHGVAHFGVAAHGAAQGDTGLVIRLGLVHHVVATHHDRVQVDAQIRCHAVNATVVRCLADVTRRIGNAGRHLIAAFS